MTSSSHPKASGPSSNGRNGPGNSKAINRGAQSAEDRPVRFGQVEDRDSADLQKVRDLLFGSQSKRHEQDLEAQAVRLEAQAARLERVEAQFSERLGAMEEKFASQLKSIEAGLREELQSEVAAIVARLDDQGTRKVERADLRSMLSDLANRIGD